MRRNDTDYFSARAVEEEELAQTATVPMLRALHAEFAAEYRRKLRESATSDGGGFDTSGGTAQSAV